MALNASCDLDVDGDAPAPAAVSTEPMGTSFTLSKIDKDGNATPFTPEDGEVTREEKELPAVVTYLICAFAAGDRQTAGALRQTCWGTNTFAMHNLLAPRAGHAQHAHAGRVTPEDLSRLLPHSLQDQLRLLRHPWYLASAISPVVLRCLLAATGNGEGGAQTLEMQLRDLRAYLDEGSADREAQEAYLKLKKKVLDHSIDPAALNCAMALDGIGHFTTADIKALFKRVEGMPQLFSKGPDGNTNMLICHAISGNRILDRSVNTPNPIIPPHFHDDLRKGEPPVGWGLMILRWYIEEGNAARSAGKTTAAFLGHLNQTFLYGVNFLGATISHLDPLKGLALLKEDWTPRSSTGSADFLGRVSNLQSFYQHFGNVELRSHETGSFSLRNELLNGLKLLLTSDFNSFLLTPVNQLSLPAKRRPSDLPPFVHSFLDFSITELEEGRLPEDLANLLLPWIKRINFAQRLSVGTKAPHPDWLFFAFESIRSLVGVLGQTPQDSPGATQPVVDTIKDLCNASHCAVATWWEEYVVNVDAQSVRGRKLLEGASDFSVFLPKERQDTIDASLLPLLKRLVDIAGTDDDKLSFALKYHKKAALERDRSAVICDMMSYLTGDKKIDVRRRVKLLAVACLENLMSPDEGMEELEEISGVLSSTDRPEGLSPSGAGDVDIEQREKATFFAEMLQSFLAAKTTTDLQEKKEIVIAFSDALESTDELVNFCLSDPVGRKIFAQFRKDLPTDLQHIGHVEELLACLKSRPDDFLTYVPRLLSAALLS